MPFTNLTSTTSLTLLFLNTFVAFSSFAQQNYQPGYIVLPEGDTLTGFVDYRNWEHNPDQIYFRSKAGEGEVVHTPETIRSFGVQDEVYVAATVQTEESPHHANELSYSPKLMLGKVSTFLQTVVGGPKSLFYYKDLHGKANLYIRHGEAFDLLTYKRYLKNKDGRKVIAENRRYLGQLALYLQDCPKIQDKINNVRYGKRSIEELFHFYYDCTGSMAVFQKTTEKIVTTFGVLVGGTATSIDFDSPGHDHLTEVTYPRSVSGSGGLFLDLVFPRNFKKWSLHNELLYTSYRIEGSREDIKNPNLYSTSRIEMAYSYVKLNILMRFAYPLGSAQIYLNGGMSNGLAVSETNWRVQAWHAYGVDRMKKEKALDDTRKYEQGYLIGVGSKLGRYSLEVRYEQANGMSEYVSLQSPTGRIPVLDFDISYSVACAT